MAGKEYSQKAHGIALAFDSLVDTEESRWRDAQASAFRYEHVQKIRQALIDIETPVESIVDLVDLKLKEIRKFANS